MNGDGIMSASLLHTFSVACGWPMSNIGTSQRAGAAWTGAFAMWPKACGARSLQRDENFRVALCLYRDKVHKEVTSEGGCVL